MGHHLMGRRIVSLYCTMRLVLFAKRLLKTRAVLLATACFNYELDNEQMFWYNGGIEDQF